ncbi:shikimate kinase [Treponema sp.]|uniref:shikimate kinase n=1 Tax=Treponema sp. TaxID=166 RepID=UPI003F12BE79
MNIILMGIKHCGKSTQGRIISRKRSLPFFDTDDVIREMTGKTPRKIYTEHGASGFQKAEEEACCFLREKSLASGGDFVIATGGGICANRGAISILRDIGKFVFLKTPEEIAGARVFREISVAPDGTLLNVPAFIAKYNPCSLTEAKNIFHAFFSEREILYEQLADIVVDMAGASKEENAEKIINSVFH